MKHRNEERVYRRTYTQPSIQAIEIRQEQSLLSGSNSDSSLQLSDFKEEEW